MNEADEEVKKSQAEALAELKKILSAPQPEHDPFHAERALLTSQLVKARFRKGLSQSELAAETGLRQPNVSRIENGKGNPSLETLLAITGALDVNLVLEYKD